DRAARPGSVRDPARGAVLHAHRVRAGRAHRRPRPGRHQDRSPPMTHAATGATAGPTAPTTAKPAGRHHPPTRRPGTATVLRGDIPTPAPPARPRSLLPGSLIGPPIVVAVFTGQQPPSDTIYGRHTHQSGFADALLILAFAHQWLLPLVASLVGGDIFA